MVSSRTTHEQIREARRRRLNEVLRTISAAELGRKAEIDPGYIHQMAKAKPPHRRNISDATAAKFERALNMAPGEFDRECVPTADAIMEERAHYVGGLDPERMRRALGIIERTIVLPKVDLPRDGLADFVFDLYNLLEENVSEKAVERFVLDALRTLASKEAIAHLHK
jgi:hypothetical protein